MLGVLYARAEIFCNIGSFERSANEARRGAAAAKAAGEKKLLADCLLQLSQTQAGLNRYREMEEYATQSLEMARKNNDMSGVAAGLNNVAMSLAYRGRHREALERLHEALKIHRGIGDDYGLAHTLGNIGYTWGLTGDSRRALEYHRQALELRQRQGDLKGEATTLDNLGATVFKLGDKQQALEYFGRSMDIRMRIGDRSGQATCLNNIGYVQSLLGNYDRTLESYQQAIEIRRETGDQAGYALVLQNSAILRAQLGDYRAAKKESEAALEIRRRCGDRAGQAYSQVALARIMLESGSAEQAEDLLKSAEETAIAIEESEILFRVAVNKADLYLTMEEPHIASRCLQQAEGLAEKTGSKQGGIQSVLLRARIDSALGRNEAAEEGFREALRQYADQRQPLEISKARFHYARHLQGAGKRQEAEEMLAPATDFYAKTGNNAMLERIKNLRTRGSA